MEISIPFINPLNSCSDYVMHHCHICAFHMVTRAHAGLLELLGNVELVVILFINYIDDNNDDENNDNDNQNIDSDIDNKYNDNSNNNYNKHNNNNVI